MSEPRRFRNRADYVSVIPEAAERILAKDPHNNLFRCLSHNISGGHEYWGREANDLFKSSDSLEEALLALELRSVLEIGIENQIASLYRSIEEGKIELAIWGFGMEVSVLMAYAENLALRDALGGLRIKLIANQISQQTGGIPLVPYLIRYCYGWPVPEEEVCKYF